MSNASDYTSAAPSLAAAVQEVRRLLGADLPSRSLLEAYRPPRHWFLRPEQIDGLHGIGHEARVLVWQEILARLLIRHGVALDQQALRWAAVTHDTQRLDDGTDFPHGQRAAAWVERTLQQCLPETTLETVVYLNTWHVPRDDSAPVMTPELAVFKDADGLDRVRLYDLNPARLRWDYSKTLLRHIALALYEQSEARQWQEETDLFDSVMDTAVQLDLVIAE